MAMLKLSPPAAQLLKELCDKLKLYNPPCFQFQRVVSLSFRTLRAVSERNFVTVIFWAIIMVAK